ncbi:MAG: hypothetical protein RJS98_16165, partial [Rhodospirillaceae bacterium]
MRKLTIVAAALAAYCASVTAHAAEDPVQNEQAMPTGDWRVIIDTPIGDMPFIMELSVEGEAWQATFINGPERMAAETTTVRGTSVVIEFPSYGHSISGVIIKDGQMQGTMQFKRPDGYTVVPFTAEHGQSHRFFADTVAPADNLAGRWALTQINSAFSTEPRVGLLELNDDGSVVVGASMVTTGDSRFLTGELRGTELYLSTFYGGGGALWRGTLNEDGTLSGQNYSL